MAIFFRNTEMGKLGSDFHNGGASKDEHQENSRK